MTLDDKMNRSSGVYALEEGSEGRIKGVILTSLKESFLGTPLFADDIINDFQNRYSEIAKV